jgi:nucleotide-binding universal stress UspA family protein
MAPYQKLLCPYDFSDTARAALRAALGLAERFGAKLALVHVVEPVAVPDYPFVLRIDEEQLRRRLDEDARKSLPAEPGPARELLIRSGIAPLEIVRAAEEAGADLVVLGTHGRTGIAHALLGSVTERVVRMSPVPVLTVHPGASHDALRAEFRRILFCTDFSENAEAALPHALELVGRSGGRLIVLHVLEDTGRIPLVYSQHVPVPLPMEDLRRGMLDRGRAELERFVKEKLPPGVEHEGVLSESASPHGEILHAAKEKGADLIVLGTHGRTGVPHLLFGSVAERVVRQATCPVLTVRNPKHRK